MYKFLLAFVLMAMLGCQSRKQSPALFTGTAMTIDYRILIGKKLSLNEYKQASGIILNTFEEVNAIYNKYNPQSEISKLNHCRAGEKIKLSDELAFLLKAVGAFVELTEQRFDPTVEPMLQLWKNHLQQKQIPPSEEIAALAPAIGWGHIHIEEGFFYKDDDSTQIDLGGIAKGYCVDLITERLCAAGFFDVYVEWGGEIRAMGKHPEERPWNVFISRLGNPSPEHAIDRVSLKEQAIATSGDYLQFWQAEGDVYSHILNAKTLFPLRVTNQSIASASVLAPNCMLADVLATAAMTFDLEEGAAWAQKMQEKFPELKFWLVSRDGS
jgi:thiamine biosynthesis lipoprotein